MPERIIAGLNFSAEKLPAAQSLPLFLKTTKTMASASGLIEAVMQDHDATYLVEEFFRFVGDADPDAVVGAVFELARCCKLDGSPFDPNADGVELPIVLGAAWFAMEVNFVNFLLAARPAADQQTNQESAAA